MMAMQNKSSMFDPVALSAFAATLGNLSAEEIRKAKRLYLQNAVVEFQYNRRVGKTMLIVLGVMSIIPVFLLIFVPSLLMYRSGVSMERQKIRNALEVWRDDLGSDYHAILSQLAE